MSIEDEYTINKGERSTGLALSGTMLFAYPLMMVIITIIICSVRKRLNQKKGY